MLKELWGNFVKGGDGLFLVLFLLVFPACSDTVPEPGATTQEFSHLTIVVTGLGNDAGQVRIALFDSEDNYVKAKKPLRTAAVNIKNRRAECLFESIPCNTYAIRLYHDENGNGKLDKADFGGPIEPYGFSNNARGYMGPAKWKDAKFRVDTKQSKMEITLD
jgi:uncharacterized protein (DUF2141 family)